MTRMATLSRLAGLARMGRKPASKAQSKAARHTESARFAPETLEQRRLLAVIAWDGGAADGDFTNPLNWEGDVMPGPEDDAILNVTQGSFVVVPEGESATVRSLEVDWPLAVLGTLSVSHSMRVGEVFFDIGEGGRLFASNLTLEEAAGGVSNAGEFSVGGASTIARDIVSTGNFTFATGSVTRFVEGGSPAGNAGLVSTAGSVTVGNYATVIGFSGSAELLRVDRTLNIGAHAMIFDMGVRVNGVDASNRVRVNFSPNSPASIINSRFDFDYARVTGDVRFHDSDLIVSTRARFEGHLDITGGTLDIKGWLDYAPQGGTDLVLDIRDAEILLGDTGVSGQGQLSGRVAMLDTGITLRENSTLNGWITLTGSDIGGAFTLTTKQSLTAADWEISEETRVVVAAASALNLGTRLGGLGTHDIDGELFSAGTITWTSGEIELDGELTINFTGLMSARFSDNSAADITGEGLLYNGGEIRIVVGNGEVGIEPRFNNPGTFSVAGGLVTLQGDITQLNSRGTLLDGAWVVRSGGTLAIEERSVLWNNADLVVFGDGLLPALATVNRNNGTINLVGAGDWPSGGSDPIFLVNNGTITKTGTRTRVINGEIRQTAAGVLEVNAGRLLLETDSFENAGTLRIGRDDSTAGRAVLAVTGSFTQLETGRLVALGVVNGDQSHLARLNVWGTMTLGGEIEVVMTQMSPPPATYTWVIGLAGERRIGRFAEASVTGANGLLTYGPKRFALLVQV